MRFRFPILVLLCVLIGIADMRAQSSSVKPRTLVINKAEAAAKLIDEFGIINSEERSARFDTFFAELFNHPGSVGYVFLFCGKECRYDEVVAHMRGIENKMNFRNFDRSRIVIQNAGFRESFRTELWLVPPGACAPLANSTTPLRDVKFNRRTRPVEAYDCCEE